MHHFINCELSFTTQCETIYGQPGIVCINHYDWNASFPGFVLNERPELVECPGIAYISVVFPNTLKKVGFLATILVKVELEVGNIIQEIPVKIIESYTPEV